MQLAWENNHDLWQGSPKSKSTARWNCTHLHWSQSLLVLQASSTCMKSIKWNLSMEWNFFFGGGGGHKLATPPPPHPKNIVRKVTFYFSKR